MGRRTAVPELYGAARLAIGGVLLAWPRLARHWVGPVADDPDVQGPLRSIAVRDALLAIAVLRTGPRSRWRRDALALCIAADALDTVVCARDYQRTGRAGAAVAAATALSGVAMGALALRLTRA